MTNFQDVLRDVHDPSLHALKTTASLSASTVYVGNPTLYAVVNTGAASDPKTFIGLTTTVIGGGATIFAVVNTAAAGQSSVVLDRGHQFVGLATVVQSSTTRTLVGNVTIDSIGSTVNTAVLGNVTIDSGTVSLTGNVTVSDSKAFIGLVSVSGFTNPLPVDATGQGDVPVTLAGETVVLAGGTNQIGSVTIPHVVSTTFSGNVTIDSGTITAVTDITNPVALKGNLTLSDSKTFIGLTTTVIGGGATIFAVVNTAAAGQASVVLDRGHTFIGLTTVVQSSSARTITGNLTIDSGTITAVTDITNPIAIKGNITLSDPKTFIGLVTVGNTVTVDATGQGDVPVTLGGEAVVLGAGTANVGFATVAVSNTFRSITGNVTLSDAKTYVGLTTTTLGRGHQYIGLVTVTQASTARTITGNLTLSDSKTFIGLTTVVQASSSRSITGNVTLSDAKTFIGLVTAHSVNAGTTKTLIHKNIELSSSSIATIAVAAGGNAIFKITNVLLNSNATARVSIKSGATYLTGNASIGVTLNPGGGWVETGSVDSPVYYGLASGAAIVMEKFDMTATAANVAGKVIFYQE